MLIRTMTVADLDEVYGIEQEVFKNPWSKASFCESISNPHNCYLVVTIEKRIVGYCGYRGVAGEGYIYNVAVKSDNRRMGIGYRMLKELILLADSRGITSLTLEVRQSNIPAILLYRKLGFSEVGIRKDLYTKPVENAVIMWRRPIH